MEEVSASVSVLALPPAVCLWEALRRASPSSRRLRMNQQLGMVVFKINGVSGPTCSK